MSHLMAAISMIYLQAIIIGPKSLYILYLWKAPNTNAVLQEESQ